MNLIKSLKVLIAATLLGAGATSWAIPMSTVGGVDNLIASAHLGSSGEATELAWVESVLGFDVVFEDKLESSFSWQKVDGTLDVYAQSLSDSPDYYLVKTGKLKGTNKTHFLFQNLAELAYAVIDLSEMGFNIFKEGTGKISHISQFKTPSTEVPEPGILSLLGMGLLGLAFVRRRHA